jgi:Na+-transporting methylmalonyl-CoA/oxaloacetate decarboxylase beta subunit
MIDFFHYSKIQTFIICSCTFGFSLQWLQQPYSDLKQAASIGIIGAADGLTSIYVATRFARFAWSNFSCSLFFIISANYTTTGYQIVNIKSERRIRMEI